MAGKLDFLPSATVNDQSPRNPFQTYTVYSLYRFITDIKFHENWFENVKKIHSKKQSESA
jgi:hypothetical protein